MTEGKTTSERRGLHRSSLFHVHSAALSYFTRAGFITRYLDSGLAEWEEIMRMKENELIEEKIKLTFHIDAGSGILEN